MTDQILAVQAWPSNAELIRDVAKVGYLHRRWETVDLTYGRGTFWKIFRPDRLVACDINPDESPCGEPVDFRHTPFLDRHFRVVVFDPPYKLNGTPDPSVDGRYGVHVSTRWQDRMKLCRDGLTEACRISDDLVLMKCQDQVCSGKLRSQTFEFTTLALALGFGLRDRFEMVGHREQPSHRKHGACKGKGCSKCVDGLVPTRWVHAAHNSSTLLVFKRGWITSDV